MIESDGLADRLRRETQQSHRDVEDARCLKGIFSSSFDLEGYRELMKRWRSFFVPIEEALTDVEVGDYRYRPRLPALADDLASLQVPTPISPHSSAASSREGPWIPAGYEEAIGACYVIEGSCLGARLICRRLHEHLGPEVKSATNFYGIEFKQWRWFRQQLDRVGEQAEIDGQRVVSGARDCFRAIELHMD